MSAKEELKQMIVEAVDNAFDKKFKEILLEALKGNDRTIIKENKTQLPERKANLNAVFNKTAISEALDETVMSLTTNNLQQNFNPQGVNPVTGDLPAGEVGLDQIMNLMK